MKLLVAWALAAGLLSGCATESYKQARDQAKTGLSAMIGPDRGLVFGERCGGGGFNLGKADDPNVEVVPGWTDGQRFFFLSLPPGEYTLAVIGSVDGGFRGNPPYRFQVHAGKAVYVGAFYASWWRGGDGQERCRHDWSRSIATKKYRWEGLLGADRNWDVYLLSQPEVAVAGIRSQYPALDLSGHVVQLAR